MPDKKLLVILLLVWTSCTGFAQTYVVSKIDFRDSINSKLIAPNTDNLSILLVDGYLSGSLPGYKFDIGEEVLKRAPLTADRTPPPWNAKKDYFIDDRVSYKDKFYRLNWEANKPVPTRDEAWSEITLEGFPISTRYYFPTLEDTLSKQDFLRAMVAIEPTLFDPWHKEYSYYVNDVAEFNGRNYEASTDNEGKSPADNPDIWHPTSQGSMILHSMRDFNSVQVLSQQQNNGAQEPVMLSILVYDDRYGASLSIGLYFYFKDAIQYLNQVKQQPLLYTSETGYLGPAKVVLDNTRRFLLLNKLKENLISKKIKLDKKMIASKTRYEEFLAEPMFAEPPLRWNIFQKPNGDFVLLDQAFKDDILITSNTVAIIPAAKLQRIFPAHNPKFITYSEALTSSMLHITPDDTVHYDTLEPVEIVHIKPEPARENFFWLESYNIRIDSTDQKTQEKFSGIWSLLQQAFDKNQLQPKSPLRTFFPCKLGAFTGLEFYNRTLTFTPDYEFNNANQFVDSLAVPEWFTEFSVTYKKTTTQNNPITSYTPVEITFQFMTRWRGDHWPVTHTLDWSDVKKILRDLPQSTEFITGIEQRTLNFSQSEVVYGVIAEKK